MMESVQTATASAAVGSVRNSGPAGTGRPDMAIYQPAGWNHVYAAWAVNAAGNALDCNLSVAAGTLSRPLYIVSNWTAASAPSTVRFNGQTLVADRDYYASVRSSDQQLWLTLARDISGAGNRLEVLP